MDALFEALADPVTRGWFLTFCVALMIVPIVGLAIWYHRNIGKTQGGRALMRRQNNSRPVIRGNPSSAMRGLGTAYGMATDISSGQYGPEARRMQNIVYKFIGVWIVALAVAFGTFIYADEVNRGKTDKLEKGAPADAGIPARPEPNSTKLN